MNLVTRKAWGAREPKYRNGAHLTAQSTCHWNGPKITVGGKTTWDHSKCASLIRGIQNFHMDGKGWSDIAYNFIECPHGYTFEGRGINVINGANGTNSGNRSSHAIMCLAGEENPFPDAEKIGFRECVMYVANQSGALEGCKGHRDHKPTACPGDARYKWVREGMPIDGLDKQGAGLIMFKNDTNYHDVVRDAYVRIVGRSVESKATHDAWAWTIGAQQGQGYTSLLHALLYEQRLREEAKFKALTDQIAQGKTQIINLELTPEVEEKILARVYADLTEKINA